MTELFETSSIQSKFDLLKVTFTSSKKTGSRYLVQESGDQSQIGDIMLINQLTDHADDLCGQELHAAWLLRGRTKSRRAPREHVTALHESSVFQVAVTSVRPDPHWHSLVPSVYIFQKMKRPAIALGEMETLAKEESSIGSGIDQPASPGDKV